MIFDCSMERGSALNSSLTKITARVPITTVSTTGACVMGNFVTNYGCSGFIPMAGADQYTITITQVGVFGQTGDKKSVFSVTARYKYGFIVNSSTDFHGSFATVIYTATAN